jgi:hypothetical protein
MESERSTVELDAAGTADRRYRLEVCVSPASRRDLARLATGRPRFGFCEGEEGVCQIVPRELRFQVLVQ